MTDLNLNWTMECALDAITSQVWTWEGDTSYRHETFDALVRRGLAERRDVDGQREYRLTRKGVSVRRKLRQIAAVRER